MIHTRQLRTGNMVCLKTNVLSKSEYSIVVLKHGRKNDNNNKKGNKIFE